MNIKQLKQTAQELFSTRLSLMSLMQELGDNFYPQRADFTVKREPGQEFYDYLSTSYPVLTRRDLGDQIGVMLRPTEKEWFKMVLEDEDREDLEAKRWLEWATGVQRRAMYDPASKFTRATKEADHDFATFGQAVVSVQLNRNRNGLLYRTWHLRDVAWKENEQGDIGFIARKWKPTNHDLVRLFPGKCHENVASKAGEKPFDEVECYHIICEADMFDGDAGDKPYWSIYMDISNDHVMEQQPVYNPEYVIPRWQTVSGSQYAYSPASITALPDARMIQSMTYTLLEAGEKAVNPPMIATQDVVRSDVAIYSGGITWVDMDYDEKLGAALRPISQNNSSIPIGFEMAGDVRGIIREAFYLNKLSMPERAPEMTAYEVGQRVQEYIRGAIPIFEPMEAEYNGAICERTFDLLMRSGGFGSMMDIPQSLSGAVTKFKFESPLHDAIEQQKGQKFIESQAMLAEAAAIDRSSVALLDVKTALRDVLSGIGAPAEWIRDEETVDKMANLDEQKILAAQTLEAMEKGANVAQTLSGIGGAGEQVG